MRSFELSKPTKQKQNLNKNKNKQFKL